MEDARHRNGPRREAHRVFLVVAVLIILLAGTLRIYHLAQRSLWLDEAIAANISRGTLSETLTLTRDLHSAPIIDPLILYSVERVSGGSLAVRLPSFVASVLAVFLTLCFVTIPAINYKTAGLAALMLSLSAAQIRYAQEVREYSLSVLYATALLYIYLSYISKKKDDYSPVPLYAAIFFAPLVQYGLVLFSFGILSALFILALIGDQRGRRIAQVMTASVFLGLGGLLSFFVTLRYQWGDDAWYLKDYFWSPGTSVLGFILTNTHHLVTYLLPGLATALIFVLAVLIYLVTSIRERVLRPVVLLSGTSCGIVLVCSLLHYYPYGGIRQCLFLAPVLCLLASESLVQVTGTMPGRANWFAFAAIVCIVVVSGVFQIRLLKPYAEIEDMQDVLHSLRSHMESGDAVYIYPAAVFAVDFYVKERDPRFMYGNYHQKTPERYVPEMMAGLQPSAKRLWIVFSHVSRDEDRHILQDVSKDWKVEPVLVVTGAALYLASRLAATTGTIPKQSSGIVVEASKATPAADHIHDSFWDWNVRNSRHPAQ